MANFTESSAWLRNMKLVFSQLDFNKDGVVDDRDVTQLAKYIAEHKGESGPEAEQKYFKMLKQSYIPCVPLVDHPNGVTADEYVEGMKKFVNLPDAKERLKEGADLLFDLMDTNKNGVITQAETCAFGRNVLKMDKDIGQLMHKNQDLNKDGVISNNELYMMVEKFYMSDTVN